MKDEAINFDTDRISCPFWVESRDQRCGTATHGDLWCPRHLKVMVRRARAERARKIAQLDRSDIRVALRRPGRSPS